MDVIPAVDILGGSVVRLMQGDYEQVTEYGSSPVDAARRWLDAGARLVHVVDLDGARAGTADVDTWRSLGRAGIPFQLGGGIRTLDTVRAAIGAGAQRVIMGTAAVWQPDLLGRAVDEAGTESIVASIDVRDGRATGAGWLDEGRVTEDVVAGTFAAGVRRFLVTAVARDGTMRGPDLELISRVIELTEGAYVMCAGGIGTLDDVARVREVGAGGVVVGRALYEGAFSLHEAARVGEG